MCMKPAFKTGAFFVVINSFALGAAFSPSTAVHDFHKKPTSQSYTNGDSPFANPWNPKQSTTETHDPFDIFVKMRTGFGEGPGANTDGVFWVAGGSVYEAFSGKELAVFEGFDVGKGIQISDNHIRQFSRKIFWFRDPTTGEIMTEFEGKPVQPIVYECQMIDYHSEEDGSIAYSVEASPRLSKGAVPKTKIATQMAGPHQMMINTPVFLDIPIPEERGGGRYQAWEFYDYNVDPSFPLDRPATGVWCREGRLPPFNMDSKVVSRASMYRVDSYDELPERMRELVESSHPHFKEPPKDEKEVAEIFGKR
mmetsp:Transcript_13219/g.22652  ORF Transcript_13219/g.22652 Transcript_13219/m.22652 type:complete len:309 (+) Transcript_13219:147-1073(+)